MAKDIKEPNKYQLMSWGKMSKTMNDIVFTDYYYRLMLLAKSLYKWEGLPNGINEKWIENYLFSYGNCIFYNDPNLGFMVSKMGYNGMLNVYNEPTMIQPIAPNYIYTGPQLVNYENVVIIRNNDDSIPTAPTIELYAWDLTNIKRTIDVNIYQQKMPLIIKCSDKQKLSLKQVIMKRDDNEPAIFGDKNLDMSDIEVLNTQAPIVFDKLQIQKHSVWNECMTFLGVNNANMDKRERLVTDEVSANDDQIDSSADVFLKARERACDEINKMFGLNISVRRRNENELRIEEFEDEDEKEEVVKYE